MSSSAVLARLIAVDLNCLLMNLFHAVSFWFIWDARGALLYALH